MGMAIIEKILARASGVAKISPGDLAVVDVDLAVLIDLSFSRGSWREVLKVHDPEKVVVVFDHDVPASNRDTAAMHVRGREFVRRFGIRRFHDVGADQGISHVVVAENAYCLPGTVMACSDSHTCSAGALNCAARGLGAPDLLYALTTGKTWFRVGETVRYDLEGRLGEGVSAKDLFLYIAGDYGDHANKNVEFGGSALANLSIDARRTLTTMGAELSAEFATFEPDEVLIDYVRARNPAPFEPQYSDRDAAYAARHRIELDKLPPMVALPDRVIRNTVPVDEAAGEPIQQAFIGSCANGTLDDLAEAARVLAGRRVARGVRLLVTPGSQRIAAAAAKAGYVQTLLDAGAVVTPATCGACYGGHMGVLGPGETCITASTRNFRGRMGDPTARIYMASPATVAASAVAGHIAHPGSI
ncbi:MAG TPA: aconitase/3-isopropylmalate dehydratase large subunit family protein [Stellaceae bacterium]|jgi:3-isopropylmalate/(R)-2-methylmalate dehydratase large subunit|nr:aconitase/3-isopropylmalate dehydratase large subunit family protein [Stellaceae bacterium]